MRILIAEDDANLLAMLEHHLSAAGHEVRTACDGIKGWQQFAGSPPDVMISDWEMPGKTGLQLCRAVRDFDANQRFTYFILMTGRTAPNSETEGFFVGADAYLDKPFQITELLGVIRTGERIIARRTGVSPISARG